MQEKPNTGVLEPEVIEEVEVRNPFTVLLFNDDWHTFEEVIAQLVKAIRCSLDKAQDLALEAHNAGKAAVYSGTLEDCLQVSSILEEIALHTQIVS